MTRPIAFLTAIVLATACSDLPDDHHAPDASAAPEAEVEVEVEAGGAFAPALDTGPLLPVAHRLAALGGTALPTALGTFTTTNPDGSTTTRAVRVYDGELTLDAAAGTYAARVRAVYAMPTAWVPLPFDYRSRGTYSAVAGALAFTPDAGRTFTGRAVPTGVEVLWQPDERIAGESTFHFAVD